MGIAGGHRCGVDAGAAGGVGGRGMEGGAMLTGWEGVALAVLTLGSCYASYRLGQRSVMDELRRSREMRRRWREFEDFED